MSPVNPEELDQIINQINETLLKNNQASLQKLLFYKGFGKIKLTIKLPNKRHIVLTI